MKLETGPPVYSAPNGKRTVVPRARRGVFIFINRSYSMGYKKFASTIENWINAGGCLQIDLNELVCKRFDRANTGTSTCQFRSKCTGFGQTLLRDRLNFGKFN